MTSVKRLKAGLVAVFGMISGLTAEAQTVSSEIARELSPSGRLRAAINFGNPVLAQKDQQTGAAKGVSVELASELANRLGVPLAPLLFNSAGKVSEAAKTKEWDIAFLAIDPVRAADIAFTAPYVIIEGAYMVRTSSSIRLAEDVDRAGIRVSVGAGSAYDLFLSRELKAAELVRAPNSPEAVDLFFARNIEVVAGVRQPLVALAATRNDVRLLPGRFMVIEQAMGVPHGRDKALAYVKTFVEEMKASGFVARALAASGQAEAVVAPAAK